MVPGKDFDSSALVGRDPRYLQNDCGKAGNLRCLGLRQLFQTSHVFLRNMRLVDKPEDIVAVFYGPPFAFWQPLAAFAHMNFVTLTGELLVRPHAPADPAIVSHSSSFRFEVRIIPQNHTGNTDVSGRTDCADGSFDAENFLFHLCRTHRGPTTVLP